MAAYQSSQEDGPLNVSTTPPMTLSGAEQEQATALMTLTKYLTPDAMRQLRRQLREHNNTQRMIFRLPAELRNCIFGLVVLDDLATSEASRGTIDGDGDTKDSSISLETYKELRPLIYGPDSMNTCRQMRSECQSLLQLDKVKITEYIPKDRIPHVFSPSGRGLLGPMVTAHCEFYSNPHPSDQAALKWART